jgi:hypothetical protein
MSPLSRDADEAVSYGMYRAMVEQRNEARAERDHYREALERIINEAASGRIITLHGAVQIATDAYNARQA